MQRSDAFCAVGGVGGVGQVSVEDVISLQRCRVHESMPQIQESTGIFVSLSLSLSVSLSLSLAPASLQSRSSCSANVARRRGLVEVFEIQQSDPFLSGVLQAADRSSHASAVAGRYAQTILKPSQTCPKTSARE